MDTTAFFDELLKLGAVTDEQAAKALDRYENLERSKSTAGQVARYGAVGGVAGPVITGISNAVTGGRGPGESLLGHLSGAKGRGLKGTARGIAGSALKGAAGSGAIPLVRAQLDRHVEQGTLKRYLRENNVPFDGESPIKMGFATSAYSTPLNPVIHSGASGLPPRRVPSLFSVLQKQGAFANAIFPKATAAAHAVGKLPLPSKAPVISAAFKGQAAPVSASFNAAAQNAATIVPSKLKAAGILNTLKQVALHDVGGPKGLLTPIGQAAAHEAPKLKKPGADFAKWQAQRLKHAELKEGGLIDSFKRIALADVGGPKGILKPIGDAVAHTAPAAKKPGADFAKWQAQRAAKAA
jgi:hypothetical protein